MIKINNKKKKYLRLGQSFLKTLLNIKYAAQLSALGESSKSGHSVFININFHALGEQVSTFITRAKAQGSERRLRTGAGSGPGAPRPSRDPQGTTS